MTFKQARKKIRLLAKGKLHSIQLNITRTDKNINIKKCLVYIIGNDAHEEPTWERAFKSLETQMKGNKNHDIQ